MERGRLFRRYFMLILALVCGALLISGGIGLYFSYQENKVALASLQHEKALSAAARIEQFVLQIEQQLAYAALPQLGVEGLEQRRIEFLKLLRVVHAVTDITQIDARGREQLSVSRLKMDEAGTDRDWSNEPAFKNARPGQTWYGPVYFRKETEPYMSIAVRSGGEAGAVTVAEVNLKFIWDVVTRIKVGQKGKAYVVDSTGHLVADPDIGLVLRKTDMAVLEQVKMALKPDSEDALAMLAKDLAGTSVLTAYAPIEPARDQPLQGARPTPLGWKVFVEQPVSEVYQALDATVIRTVALLVAGLLFSALAAMWLARSMARPISVLQEGAQRIGAGDLETQIQMKTGDELESLADQFNRMTAQLRESYAGLERKVEERTAELQQALQRQTAVANVLKTISQTTFDLQAVFDVVVENATKLCRGDFGYLFRRDGEVFRLVASSGGKAELVEYERTHPTAITPKTLIGRVALGRALVHIPDLAVDPLYDWPPNVEHGVHTLAAVPIFSGGEVVGAIGAARFNIEPFSPEELRLFETFADQAAIAIENVRLFNETKESLEQQTATSEILKAISSSTTDVQPVFEAIVQSGLNLFPDASVAVALPVDDEVRLAAIASRDRAHIEKWKQRFPFPLSREYMNGVAILERRVIDIADVAAHDDPSLARGMANFLQSGYRAITIMPMVRGEAAIGALSVVRLHPGPLTEKQIALLRTFADQAVIAIENVRLFNETKESLEQQTATAKILRVIAGSPTDVQPVFDSIASSALRLFELDVGAVTVALAREQKIELAALAAHTHMQSSWRALYPLPLDAKSVTGRAILEKKMHIVGGPESAAPELERNVDRRVKVRSVVAAPMIREGVGIGAITLFRATPGNFNEKQVALLRTFADQAAIAIENVRLFNETKESLDQQTAISEVLRVISGTPSDVKPVLDTVAERATRLCDAMAATIYVLEGNVMRRTAFNGPETLQGGATVAFEPGTVTGRAIAEGKAMHVEDVEQARDLYPVSWERARKMGQSQSHSMLAVPLLREGKPFGAMFLRRTEVRPFSDKQIALANTFADQAAIAIENVRLFKEIQEKSVQLEIANKHKSDFLANMSHELRTPLNAIIGFSEVLIDRMFGEVNEKQADYLKDIHDSGRHLLTLINDILDLSKIEAGRMDLDISSFHLPSTIANAMTLIRERAQRHGIQLGLDVDPRLEMFRADERKVKQILLNLLSNAVKFTPDGGRVDVIAKQDTTRIAIAVKDTGIGIAPEDQAAVFEEFKQVGRDYTRKAEGTGLGLALTKRFVELHGGEITLASAVGKGSTFTVTLPIRQ